MKSIKFSEDIIIIAAPELIFDFTQDYHKRLTWDTFLTKACLVDGAAQADKGIKAWCVNKYGMGMETEYVSYHRPKVTAVKMTRGPWMFKDFAPSWNFKEEAAGSTRVTFLYSFSLRFPFSIAGALVRKILQANVRQRLKDLKKAFSAGEDN